jgi:hypothetical protein
VSTPPDRDEGGKSSGGEQSWKSKERRPARFRRRLARLRLPSLPRPILPRPKLRRPKPPPPPPPPVLPPPTVPTPPTPPTSPPRRDPWFRFVTRLRAIGYWIREKAQAVGRPLRRAADGLAYWWSKRAKATRMRIYAVAGVLFLYLIVKFIPISGIPCQVSAAKECAPSNETIAFVPENAVAYAHVTLKGSSHQAELGRELRDEIPEFLSIAQEATSALPSPSGKPVDVAGAVLPWAEDDLALLLIPAPNKTTAPAFIAGIGDEEKADEFVTSIAPPGMPQGTEQDGSALSVYPGGFATAKVSGQLLFGSEAAVRAALATQSETLPQLEDSGLNASRDALPDVRVAEVYVSGVGVQRFLAGRQGLPAQLDTFVDYGATTGMAASARLRDDGIEIDLVSELDPKLEEQSPTVFADLPRFDPELAGEAGTRAIGYVGVGELGPGLNRALAAAGPGGQGLAGALRALARGLQQDAGVDLFQDLLPALGGQAALVAEPTDAVPYASLIVDGIDETKANDALARLQRPLLRGLGTGGPQIPTFRAEEVDGVTVHSVQVSASVNLSYSIFDRKLVISTQPAGIDQVRGGGDNLAGTSGYEDATDPLPDSVSALVFLNLEELFGLRAVQETLAVNPLYASLSEDISHFGSLALAVRGSDDRLRTELFLAIND